jgi:adhesin/invasin
MVKVATLLAYTGPTTAVHGTMVTLSAGLGAAGGAPVSGQKVKFTLNGKNYTGTTNSAGVATVTVTAPKTRATYPITLSFAGTTTLGTSSATGSLTVT